jgi:translocation and assembly module TamB
MTWRRRLVGVLAGSFALAVIGVPVALVGSNAGLGFALDALVRVLPRGRLLVGAVEGNLAAGATLTALQWQTPALRVRVSRVDLTLNAKALLRGVLALSDLHLTQVHLDALASAGPPLAVLPRLPTLPFALELTAGTIDALHWTTPAGGIGPLQRVRGNLRWPRGGPLELREVSAEHGASALRVAGRFGEDAPDHLRLDLHWRYSLPGAITMEGRGQLEGQGKQLTLRQEVVAPLAASVQAQVQLPVGAAAWQLALKFPGPQALPVSWTGAVAVAVAGQITAQGQDGALDLAADLAVNSLAAGNWSVQARAHAAQPEAIKLESLTVSNVTGTTLALSGTLNAVVAAVDLTGHWAQLQWPVSGTAAYASPRGELTLRGTPAAYAYSVAADSVMAGLPNAQWLLAGTGDAQTLRLAQLAVRAQDMRVEAAGALRWGAELAGELAGTWQGLRYTTPDHRRYQSARGRWALAGSRAAYQGEAGFDLQLAGLPSGRVDSQFSGTSSGLKIHAFNARMGTGELHASGELAWPRAQPHWSLQAQAKAFNPAWLAPAWPGTLSFDLHSEGMPAAFSVRVNRLTGRLRDRPVRGVAALTLSGQTLAVQQFDFASGRAVLQASGEELAWTLKVPSLDDLLPNFAGAVHAHGSVAGSLSQPTLRGTLAMSSLAGPAFALAKLRAEWDFDLATKHATVFSLALSDLRYTTMQLDALSLALTGPSAAQTLQFTANQQTSRLDLTLQGQLTPRFGWRGQLTAGRWARAKAPVFQLNAPADLALGSKTLTLGLQCWVGAGQACLQAIVDPQHWQVRAEATALNLTALPAAGDWQHGALTGAVVATGRGSVLASLDGQWHLPAGELPGFTPEMPPLAHDGLAVSLATTSAALTLDAQLALTQPAALPLQLVLSLPDGPWDLTQWSTLPVRGRFSAQARDLAPWAALTGELAQVTGKAHIDLRLHGTAAAPVWDGSGHLEVPAAQITRLGVTLKDLDLALSGAPNGELLLAGRVHAGEGSATLRGTLGGMSEGPHAQFSLTTEAFPVVDLPVASAHATAKLDFKIQPGKIQVTGDVAIPEAHLRFQKTATRTQRSSDVVVDGEPVEKLSAGVLNADVWLRLGDQVSLDAAGLTGRLTGKIHLLDNPGQATRANGELRIEDGRYAQWGQTLNLRNSRIIFAGQVPSDPTLDARAEREVGEVTAGLHVTGRLQQPNVRLYSTPTLPDGDILSYLVAGQPLSGAASSDTSALVRAATSLGVAGGSLLSQRLARSFGIDEIKMDDSSPDHNVALSVGKFLSPRLYVGYGMGLIEKANTFRLRYMLTKRWSLEAEAGTRTGADVLYSIGR